MVDGLGRLSNVWYPFVVALALLSITLGCYYPRGKIGSLGSPQKD
jgi:hypothetical protein